MKKIINSSILTFIVIALSVGFQSCGEEDLRPDSDWIVYEEGQELRFTDKDNKVYNGIVHYVEKGHAVVSIDEVLPIHCTSIDNYVNMWVDLGTPPPNIYGFRENLSASDPYQSGIFPSLKDLEINGRKYTEVVRTMIFADTVKYNVFSQRNRGIIAITDRDNLGGFRINR